MRSIDKSFWALQFLPCYRLILLVVCSWCLSPNMGMVTWAFHCRCMSCAILGNTGVRCLDKISTWDYRSWFHIAQQCRSLKIIVLVIVVPCSVVQTYFWWNSHCMSRVYKWCWNFCIPLVQHSILLHCIVHASYILANWEKFLLYCRQRTMSVALSSVQMP